MGDQLDLRDLHYFDAIATTGHVGRAAHALHKAQPTLTGAVRRLEEKLGATLFERAGRGIRLTAAGEALQSRARALLIAAQDAERQVADISRGNAGLVRIGMVPTAARFLMRPLTRDFQREAPGVSFRAITANDDVLRTSLKTGELDLAVTFTNPADDEVESHPVAGDECVVVAGRGHPIFRARKPLNDLARYGWVLGGPSVATRVWLERAFNDNGLPPPRVHIETNDILFMWTLIEETELLSFISRRHLKPQGALREVRLPQTTMKRVFALCFRRQSYQSPAARRVIDTLRTRGEALFKRD